MPPEQRVLPTPIPSKEENAWFIRLKSFFYLLFGILLEQPESREPIKT